MANGKVFYNSTSYEFEKNFKWEYSPKKIIERIINRMTSGKVELVSRYEYMEYDLQFEQITDSQLTSLQTIEGQAELVTFCPDGAGGVSLTGFFSLGAPVRKYTNNNSVSATFTESVE